ncbi:MAG: LysR family transcriptional regulator [Candidatus Sericytochromatia bacterium]
MDFAGIGVFVKVVELGSITAAAQALGLPITTASGQLAALEKRLGVTLIQRTTRQLHVTEAGQAYFVHCRQALQELETAEKAVAATLTEPSGTLRITATPDIAAHVLPPLISGYLARYPKVRVELVATYRLVDFLAEGIDLGLRLGNQKDSSLRARTLRHLQLSLWAAPAYLAAHGVPQTPDELSAHTVIGYQATSQRLTLRRGSESLTLSGLSGRIRVDDFESLKAFVKLGDGISLLPDYLAASEALNGELVRVLPDWYGERLPLRFVYPAQRFVGLPLQRLIAHCLAQNA